MDLRIARHGPFRGEEKDHRGRSGNPTNNPDFFAIEFTTAPGLHQPLPHGAVFKLAAEGVGAEPEAAQAVRPGRQADIHFGHSQLGDQGIHGHCEEREAGCGHLSPGFHPEPWVCQQPTPFHQQG